MACYNYNVFVDNADIALSDDARVHFDYYDCGTGLSATTDFYTGGTFNNAICNNTTSGLVTYYIIVSGSQQIPPNGSNATQTLTTCNPTPTPTSTPTPTPTKTSTPTPTLTQTPTTTQIKCGLGTTTGSYYYTDCCGKFVSGSEVGLFVSFDYTKPNNGISKSNTSTSVSCPTPTPTPTITSTPTNTNTPTNTKSPTPTPTKTVTPTLTTTFIPPVFKLANDCDVFTLFPLGIECVTLNSPSSATSSDGVLSLNITGGTSPYSIFWSNGQKTKTVSGLSKGSYEAQVIDFYGDYTATTICSLFAPTPTPTLTQTVTPTKTSSPIYPNLCLSILTCPAITPIQFVTNTIVNTKQSWLSSSGYQIVWNLTQQQWEIQNYTLFGGKLVSKTTQMPPLSGWFVQGGTSSPTISMTTGNCPSTPPLNITIQKSDSDCSNNGSISIATCGGQGPYQYSINGGNTFTTTNVFNSLAPQTYNVIVKDSIGNTANATSTISDTSGGLTTYTLSVSNFNTQTINAGYKKASWVVNVVPPIPQGTKISFVLNVNTTQIQNGPGSGTTVSQTNVFSGNTLISLNSSNTNTQTTTRANCSPELTKTTILNEIYNVTIGYGDVISGTSFSTVNVTSGETSANGCVTNLQQDISVFASAAVTQGCTCCKVQTDSLANGGIQNHNVSLGQGQSTQVYYSFVIGTGTTETGACSDWYNNLTRRINSPVFAEGVTVYGGSPNNPKPILGSTFVVYGGYLWTMYPTTGQVGPIVKSGQNQASC